MANGNAVDNNNDNSKDVPGNEASNNNNYVVEVTSLSQKLRTIAILDRFRSTHVRSDFITGEVVQMEKDAFTEILRGLDVLKNAISPMWKNSNARESYVEAANHLILLDSQHDALFMPELDIPHRTYGEWNQLMKKIADSKYWDNIGKLTLNDAPGNLAVTNESNERKWNDHVQEFNKKHGQQTSPRIGKSNRNLTKIVPSVKSSDSDTSFVEELSSSESEASQIFKFNRNRRKSPTNKSKTTPTGEHAFVLQPPKEVVAPMKFDLDGSITMKRFLHEYEKYFYAKFNGGSHACTQELIKFLPPEVEKVYSALGGPELKFREMEEELIKWHSTTRKYGTRYYKEKLQTIRKDPDETLTTYARRLRQLGLRAYPNQVDIMYQEIRHRFVKTVPPYFRMKLENKEDMRVEMGKSKKIPWNEVVQLAEQEDKRRSRNNDHMETHYGAFSCPGQLQWNSSPDPNSDSIWDTNWQTETDLMVNFNNNNRGRGNYQSRGGSRMATRGRQVSQPSRPTDSTLANPNASSNNSNPITNTNNQYSEEKTGNSSGVQFCHWCGKLGHLESGCWRKTGKCLICGSSEHRLPDCQSFKPNVPTITCSQCSGNHLGKDCPNRNQNQVLYSENLNALNQEGLVQSQSYN